jgi:benzylsuccinate CoA-transferase BbsF subunit
VASSRRTTPDARPPLGGVRVVALGAFVAGNVCPLVLAELGAEVVKVESRRRPEALRSYYSPDHGTIQEPSGVRTTAMFAGLTRSMRSISIEVDRPGGAEALRRLAQVADIVVENMGPGVIERWGCGFAEIAAVNPRVVMVSLSGYGRTGPRSAYRAYGSSIANYLGLASVWAHDGTHFDFVAAYHAALAALAGWAEAARSGRGRYIDVSQVETGAALMAPLYLDALVNDRPWAYGPNEVPGALLSMVVRCAGEDAWAAIEIEDKEDLRVLREVLDLPDPADGADAEVVAALRAQVERWALGRTPMQVAFTLQRAGLAAAPVQSTEDLWRDPQLRSRGAFVELDHPDLGPLEYPQSPDRMSGTPGRVQGRARRLGEDTDAVLMEWLDMGRTELASLRTAGAIYQCEDQPERPA